MVSDHYANLSAQFRELVWDLFEKRKNNRKNKGLECGKCGF